MSAALPDAFTAGAFTAEVAAWFDRSTWNDPPWTVDDLVAIKGRTTIAVVLPALNEAGTVGDVVRAFLSLTSAGRAPHLVDEILVMDSGSTDATAERARAAGARVIAREDVLPDLAVRPGKGEVMWRALAATTADLIVYVDADLVDVDASLVVALLGPLLTQDRIGFVKAFYERPLRLGGVDAAGGPRSGGGRVTELLARPAIAVLAPELAGIVQPLGGEYAARREVLTEVPFAGGYAVEIGLLVDVVDRFGLDCLAQVDVGVRKHRHRDLLSLGVTATEILLALSRRRRPPETRQGPEGLTLVQFDRDDLGRYRPLAHRIDVADRPAMSGVRIPAAPPGVGPSSA